MRELYKIPILIVVAFLAYRMTDYYKDLFQHDIDIVMSSVDMTATGLHQAHQYRSGWVK